MLFQNSIQLDKASDAPSNNNPIVFLFFIAKFLEIRFRLIRREISDSKDPYYASPEKRHLKIPHLSLKLV